MTVDPTGADLKRLLSEDDGGPVVMLNLVRYADTGADSYREYSRRAVPFLNKYGAKVLHAGDLTTPLVAPEDWSYDAILIVQYPSRQAFSQMVADPDYQQITALRTNGLSSAVLQPARPWPTDA